ncbi:MAG: transposase [Chloroflexota bacterium]|nr:transposase [Chloroflexota bacterium]
MKPDEYNMPEECPYGCGGRYFRPHGHKGQVKRLRDPQYTQVIVYRYQCLQCGRTLRVYPLGVLGGAQQSARMKGMTVLLYVLGLSYGAIEDFTNALGDGMGKTTAYNNVQAAGVVSRRRQQQQRGTGGARPVVGADATYVQVQGESVGIEVVVDDETGELLGLDLIVSENATEILGIIEEVMADVNAKVLVSDDHGAYNEVADTLGVDHQICRSHVQRNVDDLAASLTRQLKRHAPPPEATTLTPEQLLEDLEQLQQLIRARPPDGEEQLETLYERYQAVPAPQGQTKHSVWYRMRMLVTRLWNRWRKLTLDLTRPELKMDGTNNSSERLIGWWIKERYRTMRGYKRKESIKNVVSLTTLLGAYAGYFDMTPLVA